MSAALSTINSVGWALTPFGLMGVALLALIKAWPGLKKIQTDGDASLREDLLRRVSELENEIRQIRTEREDERKAHEDEMRIMRHRLNNESHTLDLLLSLIEAAPERLEDSIKKITDIRAQHRLEIATERSGKMVAKGK